MSLIMPRAECQLVGFRYLNPGGFTVGLFHGSPLLNALSALADFTAVEAAFDGYARQAAGPFAFAGYDGSNRAVWLAPTVIFTVGAGGGAESDYGYFVVNGGNLAWAEYLAGGPFSMIDPGTQLSFQPKITFKSEF